MFYVLVGIFVFITETFAIKLDPVMAKIFGVLLCVYGIFRVFRAVIRLRQKDEDQ